MPHSRRLDKDDNKIILELAKLHGRISPGQGKQVVLMKPPYMIFNSAQKGERKKLLVRKIIEEKGKDRRTIKEVQCTANVCKAFMLPADVNPCTSQIFGKRHQCHMCQKLFSTESDLKGHISAAHAYAAPSCDVCGEVFTGKAEVMRHKLLRHTDGSSRDRGKSKLINKSMEISHICNVCNNGFLFQTKEALIEHCLKCGKKKSLLCDICNTSFESMRCLDDHKSLSHPDARYKCAECEFSCGDKRSLNAHLLAHSSVKFTCEFCGRQFFQDCDLKKHLLLHSDENKQTCNYCGEVFLDKTPYERHLLTHKNNPIMMTQDCHKCGKLFLSIWDLNRHIKTHLDLSSNQCNECGKCFSSPWHLKRHKMTVHNEQRPYVCAKCDKTFKGRDNFRKHLKTHTHINLTQCKEENEKEEVKCTGLYDNDRDTSEPIKIEEDQCFMCKQNLGTESKNAVVVDHCYVRSACSMCSIVLKHKKKQIQEKLPKQEIETTEKYSANLQDETTEKSNTNPQDHETVHICDTCQMGFLFKTWEELVEHSKACMLKKPFVCDICDMRFADEKDLDNHKLSSHRDDTKVVSLLKGVYSCAECDFTCIDEKDILRRHLLIHASVKYECSFCRKQFFRNHDLVRHMKIHSDEKPFKCADCGKGFVDGANYRRHIVTHSTETPYACDLCNRSYASAWQLNRHMVSHTDERPHVCRVCEKTFKEKRSLRRHVNLHYNGKPELCTKIERPPKPHPPRKESSTESAPKPHKCGHCDRSFTTKQALGDHTRLVHTGEKPYQCHRCQEFFTSSSILRKHMVKHTGVKKHKCFFCDRSFDRPIKLTSHLHTHALYKCHKCYKYFPWTALLMAHIILAHGSDMPYNCCENSFNTRADFATHVFTQHNKYRLTSVGGIGEHSRETMYKCDLCNESFVAMEELSAHIVTHIDEMPEEARQILAKGKDDVIKDEEDTIKKEEGTTIKKEEDMIRPNSNFEEYTLALMKTLSGEKSECGDEIVQCRQCEESFTEVEHLTKHIGMKTCTLYRLYQCKQCNKSFSLAESMTMHLRKHRGEQVSQCQICKEVLAGIHSLKIHMRRHTGEKPYQCEECGKSFAQKAGLDSHLVTHTGEKPFQCNDCGKSFTQRNSLNLHQKAYHWKINPFTCEQCGHKSTSKQNLKKHMWTHTGEKPHQCNECGKSFSCGQTLRIHERIHTGERPYRCIVCAKGFAHKSNMTVHMKKHKDEKSK